MSAVDIASDSSQADWMDSEARPERWAPLGAVADSASGTSTEDEKYG